MLAFGTASISALPWVDLVSKSLVSRLSGRFSGLVNMLSTTASNLGSHRRAPHPYIVWYTLMLMLPLSELRRAPHPYIP